MLRLALDLGIATLTYAAAWKLRFGASLSEFAPYAIRAYPFVVGAQIAAVVAAGAYRAWPRPMIGVRRFIAGAIAGSAAGTLAALLIEGRQGLSFSALAGDAVLLSIAGALWRSAAGVWELSHRPVPAADVPPPGMRNIGQRRSLLLSFGDLLRYRLLVRNLVARDLKLKYRGSVLGFLWSLLNPFVMVVVYTVAFKYFLGLSQPGFVPRLIVALLAWTFFANTAMASTGAIVDSGGLIRSVDFPRGILPLSAVFFNFTQYLLTLVAFLPLLFLYFDTSPVAALAAFPVFLLLHVVFSAGIGLGLSAATVLYRDVRHLTEIGVTMLFWLTPIFYSPTDPRLPEAARVALELSPMSPFIVAYQQILNEGRWPEPHVWALAALYAAATLAAGAMLFFSLEDRYGE